MERFRPILWEVSIHTVAFKTSISVHTPSSLPAQAGNLTLIDVLRPRYKKGEKKNNKKGNTGAQGHWNSHFSHSQSTLAKKDAFVCKSIMSFISFLKGYFHIPFLYATSTKRCSINPCQCCFGNLQKPKTITNSLTRNKKSPREAC